MFVEIQAAASGAALIDAFSGHLGDLDVGDLDIDVPWEVERTGQRLDLAAEGAAQELRWGDRIVVGRARATTWRVELSVVAGPAADRRVVLADGAHGLHRGVGAAIDLEADDAISRDLHARLDVGADHISVVDLDSRHGTAIDDEWLGDLEIEVSPGATLRLGETELVLAPVEPVGRHAHHLRGHGQSIAFHRPPRVTEPRIVDEFELESPPTTPTRARFPLGASIIPVALGVAMFVVTGNELMLLFIAMGPLLAIWSFVDDRRGGRAEFRRASAEWLAQLEGVSATSERLSERARQGAIDRSPSPRQLFADLASRSSRLWQRRVGDDDFAVVRLGVADRPAEVTVRLMSGGDEALAGRGRALVDVRRTWAEVPANIELGRFGIVGVCGAASATREVLRSILVQLAAQHSPSELGVVVLADAELGWARWLPHTRVGIGNDVGVATDRPSAVELLTALTRAELDSATTAALAGEQPVGTVLIVDASAAVIAEAVAEMGAAAISSLLSSARRRGMAVVWVEREAERLPHGCRAVVSVRPDRSATIVHTLDGSRIDAVTLDACSPQRALLAARWMAPLVDLAGVEVAAAIPDQIDLVELMDVDLGDPDDLIRRWAQVDAAGGDGVVVLGADGSGAIELDLVSEGPHVLVGGTTGAGKSAMLRSWLASMALRSSPERLNIVLIDYKASAGFQRFETLPHVTGIVTNLDRAGTRRALTALEAELLRRQRLLGDAGVEDLPELRRSRPDVSLARLVLVVDEFRALKDQLPQFVDGLVDLAARGRNVGMHLVLATQRPDGVISVDIQANTNVRVALRMASPQESRDVLGDGAAALIRADRPGRGLVRRGGTVVPFQSAFVDGPSDTTTRPVVAWPFGTKRPSPAFNESPASPTDLDRIVALAAAAATIAALPPAYRPWVDPLPEVLDLGQLATTAMTATTATTESSVVLGLLDDPAKQSQPLWSLDPSTSGTVVVYGDPGSGTSWLLRRLIVGLAESSRPVHVYGIDAGGGGLSGLDRLAAVGGIVDSHDVSRLRRLIRMLEQRLDDRDMDRSERVAVAVVIDGFGSLAAEHGDLDGGRVIDLVHRLAVEGPSTDMWLMVSAERRGAVTPSLAGAVGEQLVMRMASSDEFAALGLGVIERADLPPGRVLLADGRFGQIAWEPPDCERQRLDQLDRARQNCPNGPTAPPVQVLASDVDLAELPASPAPRFTLGLDEDHRGVAVDLGRRASWVVLGPSMSGRTTALETAVTSIDQWGPSVDRVLLCGRDTQLDRVTAWSGVGLGENAALEVVQELTRQVGNDGRPRLVVVDDLDELLDGPCAAALDRLWRVGRDARLRWIVSMASYRATTSFEPVVRALLAGRHGLMLQPDPLADGDLLGVRLPRVVGLTFPPGRGYLIGDGVPTLVQVARPATTRTASFQDPTATGLSWDAAG